MQSKSQRVIVIIDRLIYVYLYKSLPSTVHFCHWNHRGRCVYATYACV